MGLDIGFRGAKKRSLFSRGLSADKFINALQSLTTKHNAILHKNEDMSFCVELCPAGFINFEFREGCFEGESRTNIGGPGFHKAVIEFLESFGSVLGAQLIVEDDTSFWKNRDFLTLQKEHLAWLNVMLNSLTKYNETSFLVSWPLNSWRPIGFGDITTPMGNYSQEFIRSVINNKEIDDFAKDYFIWYNSEKDAYYHRGIALYLMWNEFCWVKPRTDEEKELAEKILFHLEQARKLDSLLPLPVFAWKEIAELSEKFSNTISGPIAEDARIIGYRRCDVIMPLPAGWEVRLPGNFIAEAEDSGYVFWDTDRNFRLSAYTLNNSDMGAFLKSIEEPCNDSESLVEFENEDYRYRAKYGYIQEQVEEKGYWILHGQILGPGKMAVVTVTWQNEKWEEWAVEVFKDINGPKMEKRA